MESQEKQTEKWLPIKSFTGYEVSSLGAIRSIDRTISINGNPTRLRGIIKKQASNKNGYKFISIFKHGKPYSLSVHRLVCHAFLGYSPLHVDHINDKRSDNRICNLRYVTQRDNNAKSASKRKRKLPLGVRLNHVNSYQAYTTINRKWTHIGCFETPEKASRAREKFIKKVTYSQIKVNSEKYGY